MIGCIATYRTGGAFNHFENLFMRTYDDARHLNTSWSTHHHRHGQLSSPSQYKALNRLADGYPDPETGRNTAISSAVTVKFTQVYVPQPDGKELLTRK